MTIRRFGADDNVAELTGLLNRGYAALADQGLRYVASWQTPEMTVQLLPKGECFIALSDDEELIGTITLFRPDADSDLPLYRTTWHFGKFAVHPASRKLGVGAALYRTIEERAKEQGLKELACDTAKPAQNLVDMYKRWGYGIVGEMNWSKTNYESWILLKRL